MLLLVQPGTDHPGFGQSERPDWLDGMEDMVYHYLDFLDRMGLDRVHVVGISFGGWLAAELAVAHPERVSKLILSAAAGLRVEGAPMTDLFTLTPADLAEYLFTDPEKVKAMVEAEPTPDIQQELYRVRGC